MQSIDTENLNEIFFIYLLKTWCFVQPRIVFALHEGTNSLSRIDEALKTRYKCNDLTEPQTQQQLTR